MGMLIEKKAKEIHETRGGCIVCARTMSNTSWCDLTRHSIDMHLQAARAVLVEEQLRKLLPIASLSSEDRCRNMNATDLILDEAEELLAEISK